MGIFKKISLFLLRASISIALLFFLFKQVDAQAVWQAVRGADVALLFLAFFILLLAYLAAFLRWQMLIRACGIDVSAKRVCVSFCAGIFFNALLPSTIGGDLARSVDLSIFSKKFRQAIASVILDRLSGYAGALAVVLPAAFIGFKFLSGKGVFIPILAMSAIFIAIAFILFNRPIFSFTNRLLGLLNFGRASQVLKGLYEQLHMLRGKKKIIFANLGLSVAIQAAGPLVFYLIALALGIGLSPLYFFIYIPIIGAITLLPVSISGLGLRDASIFFFFAPLGVNKDSALAMSLLFFFFILAHAAIGGIIYVANLHHRRL